MSFDLELDREELMKNPWMQGYQKEMSGGVAGNRANQGGIFASA